MHATERLQTTFDGFTAILDVLRGSETLRSYRLYRRQNVFDAMMEFFNHNALQLFSDFLLRGVNARLGKQSAQIEILGL
jgi:hypothetical protein